MRIWGNIFTGSDQKRALHDIRKIISLQRNVRFTPDEISTFRGYCGLLLLKKYADSAGIANSLSIKNHIVGQSQATPGFYDLAGAFWCLNHTGHRSQILSISENDYVQYLHKQIPRYTNVDGMRGLASLGLTVSQNQRQQTQILEAVFLRLIQLCHAENGLHWRPEPELIEQNGFLSTSEKRENKLIDLGLAHGLPSLVVFFSWLKSSGLVKEPAQKNFLKLATAGTLQSYPHLRRNFPSFIVGQRLRRSGMTGWCYGDLGVGFSMILAGRIWQNPLLVQEGIEIMFHVADDGHTFLSARNALLCHGTVGIAHILARAAEYTQSLKLKNLAVDWYHFTLQRWQEDPPGPEKGLMDSNVGVALSLISALKPISPEWDCLMLLSSPYRAQVNWAP